VTAMTSSDPATALGLAMLGYAAGVSQMPAQPPPAAPAAKEIDDSEVHDAEELFSARLASLGKRVAKLTPPARPTATETDPDRSFEQNVLANLPVADVQRQQARRKEIRAALKRRKKGKK
jgi:hypothetical protein